MNTKTEEKDFKKVTIESNYDIPTALELLGIIGSVEQHMIGVKNISKKPRWDYDSWDGMKFNSFSVYLSEQGLKHLQKNANGFDLNITAH